MGIDTAEAVLLFVLVILAILLIVLGVQVFFILRELRRTVQKANRVLDNTGSITESVSGPISALSNLSTSLQSGSVITVIKLIRGLLGGRDKEKKAKKESSE